MARTPGQRQIIPIRTAVLELLRRGEVNASMVDAITNAGLHFTRQGASLVLNELVEDGLATASGEPPDRRYFRITKAGKAVADKNREIIRKIFLFMR